MIFIRSHLAKLKTSILFEVKVLMSSGGNYQENDDYPNIKPGDLHDHVTGLNKPSDLLE